MSATEAAAQAALSAGAGTFFIAVLGVESIAVTWALIGSVFGVLLAKAPEGMTGVRLRLYSVAAFVAAVLISAQLGSTAADVVAHHELVAGVNLDKARAVLSCVVAICFHPILNIILATVPEFLRGLAARLGGQGGKA